MTLTRIIRLAKIDGFRVFKTWADDGKSSPFARVNVVYGMNGSGKSTLGHLFQDAAAETLDDETSFEFEGDTDGRAIQITKGSGSFWPTVHVFNEHYVSENLRFDDSGGPTPGSLLTLGQQNVANEQELEDKKARRTDVEIDLGAARTSMRTAIRQLEQKLSQTAAEIVTELSSSGVHRYRATNVYNKSRVQERLSTGKSLSSASPEEVSNDLKLALSNKPASLIAPKALSLPGQKLVERVERLIARSITSVVLDELRVSAHADWVQQGIPLHEHRETCLFCGGEIRPERRKALDAHFDDELTRLQKDLDDCIAEIDLASKQLGDFLVQLSGVKSAYPDVQSAFERAKDLYIDESEKYSDRILEFRRLLVDKRSNPFVGKFLAPVELAPPTDTETLAALAEHETRTAKHAQEVDDAAERVELARIEAMRTAHSDLVGAVGANTSAVTKLENELANLTSRIITLESVESDPVPKADELTQHVARLLGRSELSFEVDETTKRYRISRDGLPATHLSEGERTAIALLHFLMGVRKDSIIGDPPVLVIDDPVSSLDDSIMFGASSYLWAELVTVDFASQVFLLTHKFELFRQWIIQIDSAKAHMQGGYSIQEIRMKHEPDAQGALHRTPRLYPWTTNRKMSRRLRSQYHFLFAKVATAVIDAKDDIGLAERMDLLALAPNAARKMLEAFLSFRYPEHIGDFHNGMRAALADIKDAALRTRIERYLHAYSHSEEGDISAMLDPSEVHPVLQSLFEMIKAVDSAHFESMCKSLDIETSELLN